MTQLKGKIDWGKPNSSSPESWAEDAGVNSERRDEEGSEMQAYSVQGGTGPPHVGSKLTSLGQQSCWGMAVPPRPARRFSAVSRAMFWRVRSSALPMWGRRAGGDERKALNGEEHTSRPLLKGLPPGPEVRGVQIPVKPRVLPYYDLTVCCSPFLTRLASRREGASSVGS